MALSRPESAVSRDICTGDLWVSGSTVSPYMLDKVVKLLRSTGQEVPELLEVLGLADWYRTLSTAEQAKLHEYSTAFGTGGEYNQLAQSVQATTRTAQSYLKGVGSSAVRAKEYSFAEMVLLKALEVEDGNPTDRHFVYNTLIDLYYKQRDDRDDAIEKCITYCKRDIDSIDAFLTAWMTEYGDEEPPRIPSFKRLAIIYEQQGHYAEAVDICELAMDRGLDDGTKGGFAGRKQRLQNKLDEERDE